MLIFGSSLSWSTYIESSYSLSLMKGGTTVEAALGICNSDFVNAHVIYPKTRHPHALFEVNAIQNYIKINSSSSPRIPHKPIATALEADAKLRYEMDPLA
jgi:hypothetical protein